MYSERNSGRPGRSSRRRRASSLAAAGVSPLPRQEGIKIALAAQRLISAMSPLAKVKLGPDLLEFFGQHSEDFSFIHFDFELLADINHDRAAEILATLAESIDRSALRQRPTTFDARLEWLRVTAALTKFDASVLGVGVRRSLYEPWAKFHEAIDHRRSYFSPQFAAQVLGCSVIRAREALRRNGPLLRSGLIEDVRDDDYAISRLAIELMRLRASDPSQLEAALLPPASQSTLQWDDFAHIAERDLASNLVEAARTNREGVNLLLHGAPGTGKSEFARALAYRLHLTPVFIGEADEEGGEPTRGERLAHLSMARALTPPGVPRLLVIDEADDLMFGAFGSSRQQNSKLWLNQIVESSTTPTIWIVNDPSTLSPTVIRRMSLAAGFERPAKPVRMRLAHRQAAAAGVSLSEDEAARVGALRVCPAVTANAFKAARLAGGGADTAISAARSIARAMGESHRPELGQATKFDPALSRTSLDLVGLTNRLARSAERRWSMLLSGPPGTGKSAYARFVAAACGLEVLEKKGSDLLDMFVGGTERAIACAFEEAADTGAMLILDEADSMLRDRRSADRGWEVSMVNEMLSWMEQHPMPFAATTNLSESLDSATSRRFLFKLEFQYLDRVRAKQLFERAFGVAPPASPSDLPDDLTPADFDVVARRAALLKVSRPSDYVQMLRCEAEARSSKKTSAFGFTVN